MNVMQGIETKSILARWHGVPGWTLLYRICVALFLLLVGRFYEPGTGFSSLISIGALVDANSVPALKAAPHYVYEDSYGYDGTYYVQLALHPWLNEPALDTAIDNPSYRARRILLPWTAWLLGAGQPAWIVQTYALINVGCWLGLAWLACSWFPPGTLNNFIRWFGLMFSAGMCLSVRHALTDGPGLLLVAGAVRLWELHRTKSSVLTFSLALLAKETSVLAGWFLVLPPFRKLRTWIHALLLGACVVAPTALWMVVVRARFGDGHDSGVNNFAFPLFGFAEKWGTMAAEILRDGLVQLHVATLLAALALLIQMTFLLSRWQTAHVWWRVGVGFAVLAMFVSQPVWEGYPGAAPRVLLPMALAFNVLVPTTRRWLPFLVLGNLSCVAGLTDLRPPASEFYHVQGGPRVVVDLGNGWYPTESEGFRSWRWSSQDGTLTVSNPNPHDVRIHLGGRLSTIVPRTVSVWADGVELWRTTMTSRWAELEPPAFAVPAEKSVRLEFRTDRPAVRPDSGDLRALSFAVHDLEVVTSPSSGATR
ncbi:MAG TPA: hypothetical protein PKX00_02620 [Opitutaceae bacterium]|jgi:hypothetical protein|nr:hypothetical protein [Opitutaceae bacterium]